MWLVYLWEIRPFYKYSFHDDGQIDKIYNQSKRWALTRLAFQIKANIGKINVKNHIIKLKSYNKMFDCHKDSKWDRFYRSP